MCMLSKQSKRNNKMIQRNYCGFVDMAYVYGNEPESDTLENQLRIFIILKTLTSIGSDIYTRKSWITKQVIP